VGVQAVQNVLFGRYQMVSQEVKDYVGGLYGRPPARIDPKVQSMVLGGGKGGKKPITGRPGDILEPEMEKAKEATRDIARDVGDVLIYALYPTTGMRFLRWKYGLEEPPPETRPKTLEEVKKEDELAAQARSGELSPAPAKKPGMRAFDVYVGEDYYRVEVGIGTTGAIPGAAIAGTVPPPPAPQEAAPAPGPTPAPTPLAGGETAIEAPLPGMVIRYEAKVGQRVAQGDVVVMFEAMKMQNALAAPREGTVKRLGPEPGAKVGKGDILAVIGE
jgi:pyruvate carboxylase subunit B